MLSILNQRGGLHNSCEDTVLAVETEHVIYGGVFDGCSSGKNSHWASQTLAYLFEYSFGLSDGIISLTLARMEDIARVTGTNVVNFESTAILFHYHKETKKLRVRAFGDGIYFVNGVEYEIDQNNTPDYMAHYMFVRGLQVLDYYKRNPIQEYENVDNFQICSDGLKAINTNQYEKTDREPMSLLLAPPTSENYLKRMWNILHREKFTLSDDLSIISYATT